MKFFHTGRIALMLGISCLATGAWAESPYYGSPSLLPLPQADYNYPATSYPAAYPAPRKTAEAGAWLNPGSAQPRVAGALPAAYTGNPAHAAPLNITPEPLYSEEVQGVPSYQDYGHRHDQGQQRDYGQRGDLYSDNGGSVAGDGSCGVGGDFGAAMSAPWGGYGAGGNGAGGFGAGGRLGWFGSVGGLIMTRDNGNRYYFSYHDQREDVQELDTRDAQMRWAGGFETRFGHFFGCGQYAWEAVYWGLFPGQQQSTIYGPNQFGSLNAILNFDQLSINGTPLDTWVNNADAHRIVRDYSFHNVELNFLNYAGCTAYGACGQPRFRYNWGLGVRYFNFSEDLLFSAKEAGSGTVFDNGPNQINYLIGVDNNLVGAQWIGRGQYYLTNRLSFLLGAKMGIYGNHISQHQSIYNSDGVAVVNNGPNNGQVWDIGSSKNDFAMLGELDLGLNYQMSCNWSLAVGYRAVAVTGVGLTTNQIPHDLRGTNDVPIIDSNGSLILHGAYATLQFCF